MSVSNRNLRQIAIEIKQEWPNMYYGAKPYWEAMMQGQHVNASNINKEMFYLDKYSHVVRYFLANASTWRGEVARRVKMELKVMLAKDK